MQEREPPRAVVRLIGGLIVALAVFGLAEAGLRVQPFVTLDCPPDQLVPERRVSYEHHHDMLHVPPVQQARRGRGCDRGGRTLSVLFLGDSWMENTDGIPTGVAEQLLASGPADLCVRIVNGATTSFAPSLMMLKGERLIREFEPDLVVANVDETDLMDEYLRYRPTTLRDAAGRIDHVVPNAADTAFVYQCPVLAQQPVYLLRLLELIYHDQVLLPRMRRAVFGFPGHVGAYHHIMAPQLSADPRTTHAPEIAYFRSVLRDMIERLSARLPPNRLIVSHHPHRLHLASAGQPTRYNRIVAEVIASVVAEARPGTVTLHEAMPDVVAMYDADTTPFWAPDDPFSHLTEEGLRRYGRFIGRRLEPMAAAALRPS